jgi:hypothetical protein
MSRRPIRIAAAIAAAALAVTLSACDTFGPLPGSEQAESVAPTPTPTETCGNFGFESVFSAYGTIYQSMEVAPNLTLYLNMWTDQKTHDWYYDTPGKQVHAVLNVIDSAVPLEAPFAQKRKVYMSDYGLDVTTVTSDGSPSVTTYTERSNPRDLTLDPEALHHGRDQLLITSPKGALNLMYPVDIDKGMLMTESTIGLNVRFSFTLHSRDVISSKAYSTRPYTMDVPIAIFTPTNKAQSTSCATSPTLAPQP